MDKSTIIQFVIGLCLIVAFVTRICFFQSFDSHMEHFKKSDPQSSKKLKTKEMENKCIFILFIKYLTHSIK